MSNEWLKEKAKQHIGIDSQTKREIERAARGETE